MDKEEDLAPPLLCAFCAIGHHAVYGAIRQKAPHEISTIRRSTLHVPAQKTFVREGEATEKVYSIYSGWALSFRHLPEARRQVISFLIPGDLCVLETLCFPGLPTPFSVRSLTAVSVCAFDLRELAKTIRSSPEAEEGYAAAGRDYFVRLQRRLVDIGRRSALGRVAQIILELEERLRSRGLSNDGRFYFPVRQEDLADALGLHTVYVNRTLDKLRRLDVIEFDRQWMTVRNPDDLKIIAEEE